MDEIVAQAMARWPDVPAVYGWLRLDRRGRWLVKGEPIGHRPTADFIGRNYHHDAQGRFFFQNGPQRVFVDIDHFPHVLWLEGPAGDTATLTTHAGATVERPCCAWLDTAGGVIVEFEAAGDGDGDGARSFGAVLDRDLPALVPCFTDPQGRQLDEDGWERLLAGAPPGMQLALGTGRIPVRSLPPDHAFPFVRLPRPAAGEVACV
jgi:hypothetical protein